MSFFISGILEVFIDNAPFSMIIKLLNQHEIQGFILRIHFYKLDISDIIQLKIH